MKTPKVITNVERQAARQLNLLMKTVRQQYKRFIPTATKTPPSVEQRRFIRTAEQTIASAEDIIAELKPRIAAVKRALSGSARRKKQVKRKARTPAKRRSSKKRKKKL